MNSRTVALTLGLMFLAVFATAFALINYNNSVKVWPLMTNQPLTLVIGVSFALGAGAGALLMSLMAHRRMPMASLDAQGSPPTERAQERTHAGRP